MVKRPSSVVAAWDTKGRLMGPVLGEGGVGSYVGLRSQV